MTNYSADSQINYVIQWFKTWSEFQKEDFVLDLSQKLGENGGEDVNGLVNGVRGLDTSGRPPSLFSCQLKLFNEWWCSWGPAERTKITSLFKETDLEFYNNVESEMEGTRHKLNEDFMVVSEDGSSVSNGNNELTTSSPPIAAPVFKVKQIVIQNGVSKSKEDNLNGHEATTADEEGLGTSEASDHDEGVSEESQLSNGDTNAEDPVATAV